MSRDTQARICGLAVWCSCLPAWLEEISADLREAVVHLRHVCNDVLYKSTVTLITVLKSPSAWTETVCSTVQLMPSLGQLESCEPAEMGK